MKSDKELKLVKGIIGIYNRCALTRPENYGTYLVKTNKGTYDVGVLDRKGWHLQSDKDLETFNPIAWAILPVTGIKK